MALDSSSWSRHERPARVVGLNLEARVKITESGTLHHTSFVVHDVEKTAAALGESGIGPWGV
jgi:hypothetical protein